MQRISPCNQGTDSLRMERVAVFVVVVPLVGLNDSGLGNCPPGRPRMGEIAGQVVAVGAGQDERERNPMAFGDEIVLGTGASAVGGIQSCF